MLFHEGGMWCLSFGGLVIGVFAGGVVGYVDDVGDLGDRFFDGL